MVIDTSVLLSVFFGEKHAEWAVDQMKRHAGTLCMSTVNLTETLIHLRDRQPTAYDLLEARLLGSGITFAAPDVEQARIAAEARLRLPLNLGDCYAYALARVRGCPLLTLDRDFRAADVSVVLPPADG